MRRGTTRWIEIVLLAAGLICAGVCGWWYARMAIFERRANQDLDRLIQNRRVSAPPPRAAPATLPTVLNGALLGRLVIPRLHVRAVVREGAGDDTLDVALGHIPGTALPGTRGNIGVAGHRDTLFRELRNIAKDDIIQFQTSAGTYNYTVESMRIVKPEDVSVLKTGDSAELTLVTCYPFHYIGPAPGRFIVKARLAPLQPRFAPLAKAEARKPRPAVRRVNFQVPARRSRELIPGILMSVSHTDPARQRVTGWLWLPRERRRIPLRNQAARRPIVFRASAKAPRRELVITRVSAKMVQGYVVLFDGSRRP
ncbi:MAG TPA: class D sortase [Bryobacteraceae bacterium]|nr:class D sortase [Bryobacteraceae bacterium]